MVAFSNNVHQVSEERIAQLTDVAYQAVLERGFHGSFLELELSLWNAIRGVLDQPVRDRELERAHLGSLEAV